MGDEYAVMDVLDTIQNLGFTEGCAEYLRAATDQQARVLLRDVMDPRASIARFTFDTPPVSRILVAGGHLAAMAIGLAEVGHRVVAMSTESRLLRFLYRWAQAEETTVVRCVEITDWFDLPFADASFDVVSLGDLLANVSDRPRCAAGESQRRLLAESRRVLKSSGQLHFDVPNRNSPERWFRGGEPNSNLFAAGDTQTSNLGSIDQESNEVRPKPRRFSRGELSRLLDDAKFASHALYAPFPEVKRVKRFVSVDRPTAVNPPQTTKLAKSVWSKLSCNRRVFPLVCPSFSVLASVDTSRTTLLSRLAGELGFDEDPFAVGPISVSKTGMLICRARSGKNG